MWPFNIKQSERPDELKHSVWSVVISDKKITDVTLLSKDGQSLEVKVKQLYNKGIQSDAKRKEDKKNSCLPSDFFFGISAFLPFTSLYPEAILGITL